MQKTISETQLLTALYKQLQIVPQNEFSNLQNMKKIVLAIIIQPLEDIKDLNKLQHKCTQKEFKQCLKAGKYSNQKYEFLLLQQKKDEDFQINKQKYYYKQSPWQFPGGKQIPGKSEEDSLQHRVRKDTGINLQTETVYLGKMYKDFYFGRDFDSKELVYSTHIYILKNRTNSINLNEKYFNTYSFIPMTKIWDLSENDVLFQTNTEFFQTRGVLPLSLEKYGKDQFLKFTSTGLYISDKIKLWGVTMIALTYLFSMFQATIYKKLYYKQKKSQNHEQIRQHQQNQYEKVTKLLKTQNNSLEFKETCGKLEKKLMCDLHKNWLDNLTQLYTDPVKSQNEIFNKYLQVSAFIIPVYYLWNFLYTYIEDNFFQRKPRF